VTPATHSWFWFFGALFIVGAFLAVGGILRRALSVLDRASRLIAVTGVVLALGGVGGAFAVAAAAPGTTLAAFEDMVGLGSPAAPQPPPKPGAPTVHVTGVDFKFEPSTIHVPAAKTIDVVFANRGQSPHTFALQGKGFELKTDPGGTASGALKRLKSGTYQFICTIPGHLQLGMKGTLVVGG
jgi:uncharacterized cupredoxin-like copper-binding protein